MLQSKLKCVTISHVLGRKAKHLTQLKAENAPEKTIERWNSFYDKLLEKYVYNELNGVN